MEWTDESILQFIKEYENRPVLWDPRHRQYKIRHKKLEAWLEISNRTNVAVEDLKKKMGSLMSSYRRERQKCLMRQVDDTGITWFAYNAFAFFHPIYSPKYIGNDQTPDVLINEGSEFFTDVEIVGDIQPPDEDSMQSSNITPDIHPALHCTSSYEKNSPVSERSNSAHGRYSPSKPPSAHKDGQLSEHSDRWKTYSEDLPSSSQNQCSDGPSEDHLLEPTLKKLKRNELDQPISEALNLVKSVVENQMPKKDKFDNYGQYLAGELKQMDPYSAALVQKRFGEIIFEAKTGQYKPDGIHVKIERSPEGASLDK